MRYIIIKESYESLRIVDDFILDTIREQGDLGSRKGSEKDSDHLERLNLGDENSNDFYNHRGKNYEKESLTNKGDFLDNNFDKNFTNNKGSFSKVGEFFREQSSLKDNFKKEFQEKRSLGENFKKRVKEKSFQRENDFYRDKEEDFYDYEGEDFYGNYGCEKIISRREANELYNYAMSEKLDMDNILWERDTLRFINYVGYIRLSTVSIEILPKISLNGSVELERKALLNMLSKCGILKVNYSEISSLKLYKQSLNEILAYLFSKKLQKELRKGVYGEYVYIEENINSLKGSLRVQEQIKNMASHSLKAFCRFEEFSRDNKLNKILSFFVKEVMKNIKNRETLKLLRISEMILGEVDERSITLNEVNNFSFNRLNKPFEDAFTLGKMIVLGESALGNLGENKVYSILFKMNEIFEIYIGKLLRELLYKETVHMQHSKYKLLIKEESNRGVFKLIPDIVIEKNGIERVIIDTKWKSVESKFNRHGVKREDLYQMYAYLTRYKNARTVILLYPYNERIEGEEGEYLESWYLDDDQHKRVRVYAVNLENEKETLKSLDKIVRKYLEE
ncbi:ATP-dependent helicase [Clostridium perfringens]|uniref:McrC family protein n=1 Tax=Clostridium perfringens TaxID=1502 RepID=UPI0013D56EE7|nr:McrC family protein [Clostridium perfringens]EIF2086715.1 McrC family protein [Clostridium perfringens]EIF6173684.1 McrC family protein [Clostridium perfringens]KAF2785239.1 ATP-dependent helicase [Clostridium perfringens]MCX0391829.1 McrC family protein [Clostridium perfringens]MDH5066234.1 5-methylcytosine-specific restriction enzyme subunit McrC [Clostridium perfringens]